MLISNRDNLHYISSLRAQEPPSTSILSLEGQTLEVASEDGVTLSAAALDSLGQSSGASSDEWRPYQRAWQGSSGSAQLRFSSPSSPASSTASEGSEDSGDNRWAALKPVEQIGKYYGAMGGSVDLASDLFHGQSGTVASKMSELTDDGIGQRSSRAGAFTSRANIVAGLASLPEAYDKLFNGKGNFGEVVGELGQATSSTAGVIKDTVEGAGNIVRGQARRAARDAARAAMPGAPASVIRAAAREAAEAALPENMRRDYRSDTPGRDPYSRNSAERAAMKTEREALNASRNAPGGVERTTRNATASAATNQAIANGQDLASTMGAADNAAANKLLREGGEQAAKKATEAVVRKTVVSTVAKAGARFVPGLNIAIAASDAASCASTWADPKAGLGKKLTSTVTAAGSALAATNIPIVSQIGGAISAVSSFFGSLFG